MSFAINEKVIRENAGNATLSLLFSMGGEYTIDALKEKLREIYVQAADPEFRAIASISKMDLLTGILERNAVCQKGRLPFVIRTTNGIISLWVKPDEVLAKYISEELKKRRMQDPTDMTFEVLGCITMRQPIGQAEINRYFDADKRSIVAKLLETGLIEPISGTAGRIFFVVTEKMLQKYNLNSPGDLERKIQEGQRTGQIEMAISAYQGEEILPP